MQTTLNKKQMAIISIAAHTAGGDLDNLKTSLGEGLDSGLTVNEIKEILVQMYAYAGFPRSLNGIGTFMEVIKERKDRGVSDEVGKEPSPLPAGESSLVFGARNQTKLVGQEVKGPMFDFAPAIDQYLKAHLFGDIFQRDVLTWSERELATVAGLANIKGVESQLKAHYAISMNNGITPEQLKEFTKVLAACCGQDVAQNARTALDQVLNAE